MRCARELDVPALQIYNSADNNCTPGYVHEVYDAIASEDKTLHRIEGANHYYLGADQLDRLRAAAATCTDWLAQRGLAPAPAQV